jgi:hypothetical protein
MREVRGLVAAIEFQLPGDSWWRQMAEVDLVLAQLYLGYEGWLSYRMKATNIYKSSC